MQPQIHKLLFGGRCENGVYTFIISILLTTILISSNYYQECECQLLQQQHQHQQQGAENNLKVISGQKQLITSSSSAYNPYGNFQKSTNNYNNPNSNYFYNQDNNVEATGSTSQFAQTFINHHHPDSVQPEQNGWSPISQINTADHHHHQTDHGHSPYYPFIDRPQQQTPRPRILQQKQQHSPNTQMVVQRNLDQRRHGPGVLVHEPDFGPSVFGDTIQNAIFPVTFFAFAMIFMDIMGRLVPVRLPSIASALGMGPTTTTPPPPPPTPKVTKIEFNPPPFPNIGDILAEQVAGLKRLKAVKNHGKNGHHTDSSEEYYHDSNGGYTRRRRLPSKRSKKKRKKNKNGGLMTWSKLQKLYKTYKPTVL